MRRLLGITMLGLAAALGSQTMSNLPMIVVQPFEEIKTSPGGESYASALTSMMRTAIGSGLVFQTEGGKRLQGYDFASLRALVPQAKPMKVFLMNGTVLAVNNTIQADIRVYDAVQETLAYSTFVTILNVNEARSGIEGYLQELTEALFRNVLGKVELKVSEADADVYLDSRYVGKVPSTLKMDFPGLYPGEYSLRILAPGFMDYQEKISVRERHIAAVNVQLAREPGSLIVSSDPDGAEVLVDGKTAGTTPLKLGQIQPGSYRLVLKKDRYLDFAETVSVRSLEERTLNASLKIMPGTVRIVSIPPGAEISDGSRVMGRTPLTLTDLEPKKYSYLLSLQDYVPFPLEVNLEAAQNVTVPATLTRARAPLDVYSSPPGARVTAVSGSERTELGTTPIVKRPVDFGRYRILIEKEGYFAKELSLRIDEDRTYNLEAALDLKPGSIKVATDPDNARVSIDGVYRGNSPLVVAKVAPGPHKVTASTSFGSESADAEVGPDATEEVSLSIKKPALSFITAAILTALCAALYASAAGN